MGIGHERPQISGAIISSGGQGFTQYPPVAIADAKCLCRLGRIANPRELHFAIAHFFEIGVK